MMCPLLKEECEKIDCAWKLRDGKCAITSLEDIQNRVYELMIVTRGF